MTVSVTIEVERTLIKQHLAGGTVDKLLDASAAEFRQKLRNQIDHVAREYAVKTFRDIR